jgi:hypothetical protein
LKLLSPLFQLNDLYKTNHNSEYLTEAIITPTEYSEGLEFDSRLWQFALTNVCSGFPPRPENSLRTGNYGFYNFPNSCWNMSSSVSAA